MLAEGLCRRRRPRGCSDYNGCMLSLLSSFANAKTPFPRAEQRCRRARLHARTSDFRDVMVLIEEYVRVSVGYER